MTGTPIYDRLSGGDKLNPLRTERRPLIVNNEVVTTPVRADVARAMHEVETRYFEAMVEALAPFGLHPYAIAQPTYERIAYRDEVTAAGWFPDVFPHPPTDAQRRHRLALWEETARRLDLLPATPEERSDEQPPQEP